MKGFFKMKVSIINIKINSISSNGSFNVGKTLIVRPVSNETVVEKQEKKFPTEQNFILPPPVTVPAPPIPTSVIPPSSY